MKKFLSAAVALAAASCAFAGSTVYLTEAEFTGQLTPGFYLEQFNGASFGVPFSADASANFAQGGFSYTATAGAGGLFSIPGALSTNAPADPLEITFTGAPVTAVGGLFQATDFDGLPVPFNVAITLSGGQVENIPSGSGFRGFVSDVPILSISIQDPDATATWPAMDNFYVGTAVPEPTTLVMLSLAGLALARRR